MNRLQMIRLAGAFGLALTSAVAQNPPAPAPPAPPTPSVNELRYMVQGGSYLGIGVREVDAERVKELKLKEERGVEVTSVEQGSPAESAGLKVGDVVLEYGSERVEGIDQFVRLVRETPAGRKIKMSVWRSGGSTSVMASVATRRPQVSVRVPRIEVPDVWIPDIPNAFTSWKSSMLGIEAEALKGQFATYFGVNNGVLVRSVTEGSPAEKAGIKAGDVITKAAGKDVTTPRELTRALRDFEGKGVAISAVRDHKEMNFNVMLSTDTTRGRGRGERFELE